MEIQLKCIINLYNNYFKNRVYGNF